jgi:hypothetical protein
MHWEELLTGDCLAIGRFERCLSVSECTLQAGRYRDDLGGGEIDSQRLGI